MFFAQLRATDLARSTTFEALATPLQSPLPSAIVTYSTEETVTATLPGGKISPGVQRHPVLRSTVLFKGASIYDVRTEGGGGVSPKEDVVREVA